jgi:sec-independent protein translocase protein TatA
MSLALIPGLGTIGAPELVIALVVILLLFGAKRIPELARGLGSGVREFKAGTKEGQLEDKKEKDEGDATAEAKSEAKADDDATAEAEKAEQKRS